MGIDLNSLNGYPVGLNQNLKVNTYGKFVYFGNTQNVDTFQSTSPVRLFQESEMKKMIANSPELQKLLSEHKIPVRLNMKELHELRDGHAKETQEFAVAIANNLPPALRQQVNIKDLKDGALLHDFGRFYEARDFKSFREDLNNMDHDNMLIHMVHHILNLGS
jgi:HD-GYP domain-containing protein (c-di-GMP phosphodiesterase class II)